MLKNIEMIFSELDKQLMRKKLKLNVICARGYVLKHYGIRETRDIDGFYNSTPEIRDIISTIGNKYKINQESELWLNNSVQNLNDKPPESICELVYEGTNLKIFIPPLEYIAGMKLRSERGLDIRDVAYIISYKKIKEPKSFKLQLEKYGFSDVDDSLILEAFSEAYGLEWLEKYYVREENEFLASIQNISSKDND